MSTSNLKARHYSALASRLRNLQANLTETEKQLEMMSDQLNSMARLGVGCGSQFMAVSRLLDVELMKATQEADQSQPSQQRSHSNYDESTANISRSQ